MVKYFCRIHRYKIKGRLSNSDGDGNERDDLQRRCLAQLGDAVLEQRCNNVERHATMLKRCVALKIVVANRLV